MELNSLRGGEKIIPVKIYNKGMGGVLYFLISWLTDG